MPTLAGIECPVCHVRATVQMGILPLVDQSNPVDPVIILGGNYSVCDPCFVDQYKTKYGYTPDEAPSHAPPDRPQFKERIARKKA